MDELSLDPYLTGFKPGVGPPSPTSQGHPLQDAPKSNFLDWCSVNDIPPDLRHTLRELRLDCTSVLRHLLPQDIQALPIPVGHRIRLRTILHPSPVALAPSPLRPRSPSSYSPPSGAPQAEAPGSYGPTSAPLQAEAVLDPQLATLLGQLNLGQVDSTPMPKIPVYPSPGASCLGVDLDPRVHLTPAKGKTPYLRIVDFLGGNYASLNEEEVLLSGDSDMRIVLQSTGKKPDLSKVSPSQWAAANNRIQAALLESGQLRAEDIGFYLAYSNMICDFAQTYIWTSVLDFDDRYRALQAQFTFRWGSNAPILRDSILRPRPANLPTTGKQHTPAASASQHQSPRQPKRPPRFHEGREICGLWNARAVCRFGETCRFAHRCDVPGCGATHPRIQHPGGTPQGPPGPFASLPPPQGGN